MTSRLRDETGSATLEFIAFAVLLLLPLIYLALASGRVQASQFAAVAGAREGARVFVAESNQDAAAARAELAVRLALDDFGMADQGTWTIACSADPCLSPDAEVTVTVRVRTPMPLTPAAVGGMPLTVTTERSAVDTVERFRG